jgi:hypothetical protein
MELLHSLRDLGIPEATAGDAGDERIRALLAREMDRDGHEEPTVATPARWTVTKPWKTRRGAAVLTGLATLVASTAVAAAAGVAPWALLSSGSASNLFSTNPSQVWWQSGMSPLASSVTQLGNVSVPGVAPSSTGAPRRTMASGAWRSKLRTACGPEPRRRPPGTVDSSYNFSGTVPGCGAYSNISQGGGFHWSIDEIGPNMASNNTAAAGALSAVIFGAIDNPGAATQIVDGTTGTSTPILDGHYFALVEPRSPLGIVRLQAVDSAGNVTSRANPSPAA